jgi:hypothetical protein
MDFSQVAAIFIHLDEQVIHTLAWLDKARVTHRNGCCGAALLKTGPKFHKELEQPGVLTKG